MTLVTFVQSFLEHDLAVPWYSCSQVFSFSVGSTKDLCQPLLGHSFTTVGTCRASACGCVLFTKQWHGTMGIRMSTVHHPRGGDLTASRSLRYDGIPVPERYSQPRNEPVESARSARCWEDNPLRLKGQHFFHTTEWFSLARSTKTNGILPKLSLE